MVGGGLETVSNVISSMNHTLKSVPGLADVGVLHGDEVGPRALAQGPDQKSMHTTLISVKN